MLCSRHISASRYMYTVYYKVRVHWSIYKIVEYHAHLKAGFHWRRSRTRESASDLVKIENRSRKRSHKLDSAYDSDAYNPVKTRLLESQAEAYEPTNHNASSQALRVQSSAYDSNNLFTRS